MLIEKVPILCILSKYPTIAALFLLQNDDKPSKVKFVGFKIQRKRSDSPQPTRYHEWVFFFKKPDQLLLLLCYCHTLKLIPRGYYPMFPSSFLLAGSLFSNPLIWRNHDCAREIPYNLGSQRLKTNQCSCWMLSDSAFSHLRIKAIRSFTVFKDFARFRNNSPIYYETLNFSSWGFGHLLHVSTAGFFWRVFSKASTLPKPWVFQFFLEYF